MSLIEVSVIVPCYNHDKYIGEALQSIIDQTYQNWECIIVNDGSPDQTEMVAKEWCDKDSRFRYLFQENGGLSNARNYGIQNANGIYILTLDADDKFEPTFIEKAQKILLNNQDVGIVCSWGYRFMEGRKFGLFQPNGNTIKDFLFYNSGIASSLFRKECWEKVGGYDEKMKFGYEDWEFYISVCKLGWKVHVIQEPLFFYRQHHISMRTVALNNYDAGIKKYIYQKHEELYKEYYEDLIDYFLGAIALEKKNTIKTQKKIDFRVGAAVLKPLRIIKNLFK
nr:glycosyltransferase family A protein [uncultured Flavobacterium sp.]